MHKQLDNVSLLYFLWVGSNSIAEVDNNDSDSV